MALILTTIGFLHGVSYALEHNMNDVIFSAHYCRKPTGIKSCAVRTVPAEGVSAYNLEKLR